VPSAQTRFQGKHDERDGVVSSCRFLLRLFFGAFAPWKDVASPSRAPFATLSSEASRGVAACGTSIPIHNEGTDHPSSGRGMTPPIRHSGRSQASSWEARHPGREAAVQRHLHASGSRARRLASSADAVDRACWPFRDGHGTLPSFQSGLGQPREALAGVLRLVGEVPAVAPVSPHAA
jgi:hypothetical protein